MRYDAADMLISLRHASPFSIFWLLAIDVDTMPPLLPYAADVAMLMRYFARLLIRHGFRHYAFIVFASSLADATRAIASELMISAFAPCPDTPLLPP